MNLRRPSLLLFRKIAAVIAVSFFFLRGGAAFAEGTSREIKIIAAVSSSFQKNPEWQKEIRDRVLYVNQTFEKQFGIHFSVYRFINWEPQDEKRETNLLIEELHSAYTIGLDEVVMGFHKMSQPFEKDAVEDLDTVGTAQFFRGYLIIRDPFNELASLQRQVVLLHEVAHLFGAIHISGKNDIMNASLPSEPAQKFDEENKEIIDIARRVDFQTGISSIAPQEIDQLIQIYEQLIRKNPKSDFYYQLGKFYEVRKLPARAIATWEEALRVQYTNPLIHWELGKYYYENSRFDAAIQELGASIAFFILPSQQKQRAQAFNFLGVAYYKKGNLDQAIVNWLKGLSSDPDNLDLQGNLAAAYLENGDLDRGVNELLKLAAKYPDDATTLSNLSVAYRKKKDFEKAVEFAQRALDRLKEKKEAEAGTALHKKSKKTGSQGQEKLMMPVPEAELRINLAVAYLGLKKYDLALPELLKAKEAEPDNVEIMQNLTYIYLQKENYSGAIQEAEAAVKLQPQNSYLNSFLAQAYAMTGKKTEALKYAKLGIQYAEPALRANLRKNVAMLYLQNQQLPEAAAELKNSLNDNWNDPDTHVRLGYVYGQMGKLEEARRSFETALRVNPNTPEAKKALASMQK
jgi:tetratricopeptide (TPR) repeat protein